jgi:hypothetical protein
MENSRIEDLVEIVLRKEFSDIPMKQGISKSQNRLNISCPYCGDSKNHRKKRGNFYLDTLTYKCYNGGCGIFKDSISFFKDFGVFDSLTGGEKREIVKILDENKSKKSRSYGKIDFSLFVDSDFDSILINRDDFCKRMKLVDVENSKIISYIRRRHQSEGKKFAWDPKRERLFLFNLTPENKVLGLQVRNMESIKGSSKYLTYRLSGIYSKLLGINDEIILEKAKRVDPVSHVFGIGSLDFSREITIFEGPMDSWLWGNSVGLCSLENRFPFETDGIRYWYDWDDAGIKKSSELLGEGKNVFNWGKFLEDHSITKNRKWDLNDLVIHLRTTGKKINRFENYFTKDVLDLRYFIR